MCGVGIGKRKRFGRENRPRRVQATGKRRYIGCKSLSAQQILSKEREMMSFCFGCGFEGTYKYKKDCFFFHEEKDMGATIPTCGYHSKSLGFCPCENCKKYISKSAAYKIVKAEVDKI